MFKTWQQIMNELIADVQANTPFTNFGTDAALYALLAVFARALFAVWFMLQKTYDLFFVSTSSGSFLERRAAERNVNRKQGVASTGPIRLTRTSPAPMSVTLTAGTTFATMDGSVEFTVNADTDLPLNWTDVTANVTCTVVGVVGNLPANTALQLVGVTVPTLQTVAVGAGGLAGGVDTETDAQLMARYLHTIQNPINGGTPADYVTWAEEVEGVVSAISLPLNRGNGTIDVVITDGGIPTDALVSQVSTYIQTQRPVGADVQVLKPTAHTIDVTGVIVADQGYTNANLAPLVVQAIKNYLASIPIGGVVRFASIIMAALSVKGVIDFNMTAPAANIVLAQTEIAEPGNLNVT